MLLLNPPKDQQIITSTPAPRPAAWTDPRWIAHFAILAGVIGLSYFGVWRAYFATLDDLASAGWLHQRATWWDSVQEYADGVHFLNYLVMRLKTELFGLDASLYLWSSLLQYLVLTWLVYGLAFHLLRSPQRALLAALFFAANYSHYEVVTSVSASDYTLWGSVYLVILLLFAGHLRSRRLVLYWAAVAFAIPLAFAHDFTLSLALVLTVYYLTLGLGQRPLWSLTWCDMRILLPFWVLWMIHVGLQCYPVIVGTAESVYAANRYTLGLHMLANLRYLIFLAVPNMRIDPIQNFLTAQLPGTAVNLLWESTMLMGVLVHGMLLWLCWRGTALTRFAIALIYLPFLLYTPWSGHMIEAPRYLLLPSVGCSLLVTTLLLTVIHWISQQRAFRYALALMAVLIVYGSANVLVLQVWVQRQVENGQFRRTFVNALLTHYPELGPQDEVWIEVPTAKFLDLAASCQLVFVDDVPCRAFTAAEAPPTQMVALDRPGTRYWLRATATGIEQVQPVVK